MEAFKALFGPSKPKNVLPQTTAKVVNSTAPLTSIVVNGGNAAAANGRNVAGATAPSLPNASTPTVAVGGRRKSRKSRNSRKSRKSRKSKAAKSKKTN